MVADTHLHKLCSVGSEYLYIWQLWLVSLDTGILSKKSCPQLVWQSISEESERSCGEMKCRSCATERIRLPKFNKLDLALAVFSNFTACLQESRTSYRRISLISSEISSSSASSAMLSILFSITSMNPNINAIAQRFTTDLGCATVAVATET